MQNGDADYMRLRIGVSILTLVLMSSVATYAGVSGADPLSKIPQQQRASLTKRISQYVTENRNRNWNKLYDLISSTGRGAASREMFVAQMRSAHGVSFANSPDLQEFVLNRVLDGEGGGFDIYGCGKAQREGNLYKGIAVMHAVYEQGDWFFTGWSFTSFPNEACKDLADPGWEPENRMGWDKPMEELRSVP
jgi:hypothetical protein